MLEPGLCELRPDRDEEAVARYARIDGVSPFMSTRTSQLEQGCTSVHTPQYLCEHPDRDDH